MAMQLQYVKIAHYEKDVSCPHNDGVRCDKRNCYNCGWNPKVHEKRLEQFQKARGTKNG